MLWLAHILVFLGTAFGILYILTPREKFYNICMLICVAALLFHVIWLIWTASTQSHCPLLDFWGVMAVITMTGIIFSWQASILYWSPRIFVGGLILTSLAVTIGRIFISPPGTSDISLSIPLSFHIFFSSLGYGMLVVGCVTGILIMIRSSWLKSANTFVYSDIPWSSLTALDRLFFHSVGLGIILLAAGMLIGIASISGASLEGPWYLDLKVTLTSLGCFLFMVVWLKRRKQGFCSRYMVALATLGYAFLLMGFFASSLFTLGFHRF